MSGSYWNRESWKGRSWWTRWCVTSVEFLFLRSLFVCFVYVWGRDRPSLRSSHQSTPTCTAWASWWSTSRTAKLWGKPWRPRSIITSSPTSPSSTKSANGRHSALLYSNPSVDRRFSSFLHINVYFPAWNETQSALQRYLIDNELDQTLKRTTNRS